VEAKPQGSLGRGHGVRKYTETGLFFAEVTMKGYTPKTKCSPARTVTSKVAFEMSFTSDMGAAAAKDVLVRRMWPVRTTSKRVRKTFEGVEKGEPLFKALNFPDASWCELMGLVFACAANESDFAKAKKTVAVAPVTSASKAKPLVTPVPKKRKTGGAKDRRVKGGGTMGTNDAPANEATIGESPDQGSPPAPTLSGPSTAFPTAVLPLAPVPPLAPPVVPTPEARIPKLTQARLLRDRGDITETQYVQKRAKIVRDEFGI
jgi:hypothetical protein|tara:strand:- start:1348 stop:2130 length:783 start_codon:yes stop_codon:yes gene_type:complete